MDVNIDVVELCGLLHCLGFTVKSLDSKDVNASQDIALQTVVVNCPSSGLQVVLESPAATCSCPSTDHQNSGFWQVSGVTGGKQQDKESGSSLLCSLPKTQRERISKELTEMIKRIKQHNEEPSRDIGNRSTSMLELKTPEKSKHQVKLDTPTRYRSLDTLTTTREGQIPPPGLLQKKIDISADDSKADDKKNSMCRRQSTYTLASSPGSVNRIRNKTSSPIQQQQNSFLEDLLVAERAAEDLRNKLSNIIRDYTEGVNNESSMSSLVLDISKISTMKGMDSKSQFVSSPNLSGILPHDEFKFSRLKRIDSASTSNLVPNKLAPNKESKISRLRRISPNIFRLKRDSPTIKPDKSKSQGLFKAKIVTPVRTPKSATDISSSMSASKKKFSHVKSTIPRPTPKKE